MYHNKRFKSIKNSEGGEVGSETVFHYRQGGSTLWATYRGDSIQFGTIIGKVDENGTKPVLYSIPGIPCLLVLFSCPFSCPFSDLKDHFPVEK